MSEPERERESVAGRPQRCSWIADRFDASPVADRANEGQPKTEHLRLRLTRSQDPKTLGRTPDEGFDVPALSGDEPMWITPLRPERRRRTLSVPDGRHGRPPQAHQRGTLIRSPRPSRRPVPRPTRRVRPKPDVKEV